MQIRQYNTAPSPNFGIKLDTASVLEVTSLKIFKSEGISGIRQVVNALNGKPSNYSCYGHKGFRYQAELFGEKIQEKYPQIKEATEKIIAITEKNPAIKKQTLNKEIKPIIQELGEEIDITI